MRFYNPQPREYQSTYVDSKLPYDYLLKALSGKQADYDDQVNSIKALKKEIPYLPVDTQEAQVFQKAIDEEINSLKDIGDLTSPQAKRKILEAQRNLATKYRDAENVFGTRKARADEVLKDIDKLKDETQKKFLRKQITDYYYNPQGSKPAQFDRATGNYNPIEDPDLFTWKGEIDKDLSELAKNVESDKIFQTYGVKTLDEFNKRFTEGTVETRDYNKIMNSLAGYANTPEVAKTIAAQRAVNYGEDFNEAYKQESQAFIKQKIKNKQGKEVEIVVPNPNTLLGQKINSAINARVMRKEEANSNIFDDYQARLDAKQKAEQGPGPTTNTVTVGTEGTGNFVDALPSELAGFFDKSGNLNLNTPVPVDKITFTSQGVLYPTDGKDPKTTQYANNMLNAAKSISGMNNEEFSNLYNKVGFKGIEDYVKGYYQNISLVKDNIQQLQPQEEETFTQAFLGTDKKGTDKDTREAGVNYRQQRGRITDKEGNLVKDEDITNKNTTVTGIDYSKPGMLVLASNNGESYRLESTNQDLKRATKDVSDIKNKILTELKNPKSKNKDIIDDRTINYQDGSSMRVQTIVVRDKGFPETRVVAAITDSKGNIERVPLESNSIEDLEKYNTSKLLNSPSFRSLIKQKEVKQEFED